MSRKKANHPSEYLNNLSEWNEHQYDRGYWTGGKTPPHIKYGGRAAGIGLFVLGIVSLIVGLAASLLSSQIGIGTFMSVGLGVLMVIAGVRKYKNKGST